MIGSLVDTLYSVESDLRVASSSWLSCSSFCTNSPGR